MVGVTRGWLLVACLMATRPAAAQAPELEPSEQGAPTESETEAHALFQAGRIAFDQGRYEVALERFGGAYELTGHAELLYNMALAADRARLDGRALALYERFLAEAEAPEDMRRSVKARVTGLRRALERREASEREEATSEPVPSPSQAARSAEPGPDGAAAPPGATRPDEPADDDGVSPWVWVGVGGGALAVGAAVVAAVLLTRDGGGPTAGDHGVVVTTLGAP